ncbi:hypothetical protein GP486_003100 [Trichoglossum hirsutum]|uniref:Uncharacterized protein n=1 Tax=Trichoglossum hirsutum TaxID=265104 RepID=A0A9P8LDJ5_9PEZI|nr:hypothetical protein GP486_003100 [Trichoglossum hirsutum]
MGAYVSKAQCQSFHSISLDCTVTNATDTTPYRVIGGLHHGEFEPNPDVAGVGVLYAFFSVACLALATSATYLILQLTKFMKFTGMSAGVKDDEDRSTYRTTWADIFEAIILSCSDQQVFTSGAYALALRYAQGCSISAYHYNIVANMMLITCATHLMSVTVVSQYWKHKLLAIFRTLLISGLYIVTALLLTNQNAGLDLRWPTDPPKAGDDDTLLVLPAACFQGDKSTFDATLVDTFGRGGEHLAIDAIGNSSPNNHIVGWNFFILIILWYGFAIIAEFLRYWYRFARNNPRNRRTAFSRWILRAFWSYQFIGASFCIVAIAMSYKYIQDLRRWMDHSPWIHRQPDGTNPENDASSFGQFVPLLLILLTVFTVLQLIGGKFLHLSTSEVLLVN